VAGSTLTVSDVVRDAIAKSYARLLENEAGIVEGNDPEAIHQARVATRRLRSDLRTFEPFLDERFAAQLRGELRWLGADLGAVRDIEVMRDRLRGHAASLPVAEADAVNYVLRRLDADREAARSTLLTSMRTSRYAQLREALADAALYPQFAASPPDLTLTEVIHKRWRKLKHAQRKLGHEPADDALHNIRIRAKRCRYAAEACVPALGRPATKFAKAMADVQDVLGEHHDAVVSLAWLAKTAPECTTGEAYALGRLAEIEHAAADDSRDEFRGVWKRARDKKLRRFL
jgi:CHAD domain-containing protein